MQITGNLDAFVRLPGFCDLKILIQMTGMITHLIVRPVSKAEITAKEIRSRITDQVEVKQSGGRRPAKMASADVKSEPSVNLASSESVVASDASKVASSVLSSDSCTSSSSAALSVTHTSEVQSSSSSKQAITKKLGATYSRFSDKEKVRRNKEAATKTGLTVGLLCHSFTLTLLDESHTETISDLICIHLEDLFFSSYPVYHGPDQSGCETSFAVSVSNAQIDNQRYGVGAYDFPVIFIPQKGKEDTPSSSSDQSLANLSVLELHAVMKSKAFIHAQIVMFSDPIWQQSVIDTVAVSVRPLSLYVDDTFIYRLVEELEAFAPSRLSAVPASSVDVRGTLNRRLPEVVRINSCTLSHPIRVKHLTIQPIKMLLSVHASLKLFLASDHTPLSVSKFERVHVYSTLHRIAHVLTVHYASAAIFRAGKSFCD